MSRRHLTRLRNDGGFTLVEMVVVLAVLGVVIGSFEVIFSSSLRHVGQIQEQTTLQTQVRSAVDTMARDLRQAYSGTAISPIESASATAIQFLSPDRALPFHVRRIAYRLNGGWLERAETTSTDTDGAPWTLAWLTPAAGDWVRVVDSVKNASPFSYLDVNNVATTTASAVRTITVTVALATKTSTARQFTYTTSTTLRTTA